jgi:hypothetical protein
LSTSNWQNISYNIELVKKLNPKSILDVGVGFGRWGILFREYLELWNDNLPTGDSIKWKRIIDGIEIYKPYLKPYHNYFYNKIYVMDAFDFLISTENKYDLINCGDVIEHFDKDKGICFIETALVKAKYVLINIPLGNDWQQGALHGNEFEVHRSVWGKKDFSIYHNRIIKIFRDMYQRKFAVVLLSPFKIDIEKEMKILYGRRFNIRNFIKYRLGFKKLAEFFEKG